MFKKRIRKPISFILVLALAFATVPVFSFAGKEGQTYIDMPVNWSQKPMEAAVNNGLLQGSDTPAGKVLSPQRELTRAEMATIVNRAFGATETVSLSSVKDVAVGAWYEPAMGAAAKMGTFKVDRYMRPNDRITRQEAFTVLGRALKLDSESQSRSELNRFKDGGSVAEWAKNSVSNLVKFGYIEGYNGKMNPTSNITRAEFAQVMDNILKQYVQTPGTCTVVGDGNVMVNAADAVLKDVSVKGDLIVGDGVGDGDFRMDNVSVTGRLVVRGGGLNTIIITGNSQVDTLLIAKVDGGVRILNESSDPIEAVYIDDGDDTIVLSGSFGSVSVETGVPVSLKSAQIAEMNAVTVFKLTLDKESLVNMINLEKGAAGSDIVNNGKIGTLKSETASLTISGSGTITQKDIPGETPASAGGNPGGSNHSTPIAPENPINMAEVLNDAGVPYDFSGQVLKIGANEELLMSSGSTNVTFDGITCTVNYAPVSSNGSVLIDPAFFKEFLRASYSSKGEVILPDYVKTMLTGSYTLKSKIYQNESANEEAFMSALNPRTGWDFALELGMIGSAENGMGFRTGGTIEGQEAAQLVYDKFEELGFQPHFDYFTTYAWRYLDSSLTISSGGIETTMPAISAVGTKGTDLAGISGELVDIGKATKQDFISLSNAGIDLTGKIALIAVDLDYQPWQSQACYSAEQHGAAGVIYYCHNYYGQYTDGPNGQTAFNVQDWSGPEIEIPVLNVPKKYGIELKGLLSSGKVDANIMSKVEIVEDSTLGTNVYTVIEGSKYPDEYVMVNAHTDAYFTGFQDDSIAVGAMIAFAEAITNSGIQPDRSIILLAPSAEEFGAMDIGPDWLIGSWCFMRDNEEAQTWIGNIVSSLTLELMAYIGAADFEMRASDTLYEYILNTAKGFEYRGHNSSDSDVSGFDKLGILKNEVSNMSDEFTMVRYGVPTFRTNTHSQVVSQIYHSQFDCPETTSFGKYSDCLRYFGSYLMRMDQLAAAPYDLTLTADKYASAVDFNYLTALGYNSSLKNASDAYRQKARELYLKNSLILKLTNEAAADGKDITTVEAELAAYNSDVRDTVKTVIEGTTRLAGESVAFEVPFYIKLHKTLSDGIDSLIEGKGPDSEAIFRALPARYYTNYLEYDSWYLTNRDNINLDNREVFWANDIKLQYLDIYEFYQGLKLKSDNDDFSSEIATATEWLAEEAVPHLQQAVSDNIAMFNQANTSLSAANSKADSLIAKLKVICQNN